MKLVNFARQHAKLLWGVGGAAALGGIVYAATRSGSDTKKKDGTNGGPTLAVAATQLMAAATAPDSGRWALKGQRVIAWPRNTDVNGQVYIKFTEGAHVRGGWIDETSIQRDADVISVFTPDAMANAGAYALGLSAGGGGGGGSGQQQLPQEQPLAVSTPNATVLTDGYMFTASGGKARLTQLVAQLQYVFDTLTSGKGVFVDESTFRKIYMHQGVKVLDLIAGSIFYKNGNEFTTDNLANHAWCQTYNAQVVGLGNDWYGWFYSANQVYRYPSNNPNYAGVPIDPLTDPAAYEAAAQGAIESSIQTAMKKTSLGGILNEMGSLTGIDLSALYGGLAKLGYMIEVPQQTRDYLVRFARDMAAKNKTPLPTTSGDGQPISDDMLLQLHASAGALIAGGVIDMFESHDDKLNPCIRPLNPELVLSMIATVVGFFLTIISLGSAGAFGVAISAISFVYNVQDSIQKLANLSK